MIVGDESEAGQFEKFRVRHLWVRFIANLVNSDFTHRCNPSVAQASGEQLLFMDPISAGKKSIFATTTPKPSPNWLFPVWVRT